MFQVVAVGEGQALGGVVCKISSDSTANAYTVIELTLPPGAGAPLHVHQREDEVFTILEGQCEFQCDGQTRTAQVGAVIVLPRGSIHAFKNSGETPMRALITAVPGGLDRYFAELGAVKTQGEADALNVRYAIDFSPEK